MSPKATDATVLRCNFCNKSQRDVKRLISGPNVYICDECVDICVDIEMDADLAGPEAETNQFNFEQGRELRLSLIRRICELSLRADEPGLRAADAATIRNEIRQLAARLRRYRRPKVGDIVAGGKLVSVVGAGNFATVWEATPERAISLKTRGRASSEFETKRVAVKIFDDDKLGLGVMLWRFQRGVQAMQHLSKIKDRPRSIVGLLDVDDAGLSFSMEFAAGGDLENVKRLAWTTVKKVAVFREVATAIEFAHNNGIIHRDVKPANIVLDESANPVVTDFDIADLSFARTQSVRAAGLGSPQFAAPEQLAGDVAQATRQVDVFSLGKLLYFLLAETPPPLGPLQSGDLPGYLAALEPEGIGWIVARAIRLSPRERFASVADLLGDLNELLEADHRSRRTVTTRGREQSAARTIILAQEVTMRDKYDTKQAGVVGPGGTASHFQQIWSSSEVDEDTRISELKRELQTLRAELGKSATTAAEAVEVGAVASAEVAVAAGDGAGALEALKRAGRWSLDTAEKLGLPLTVAYLKGLLGL